MSGDITLHYSAQDVGDQSPAARQPRRTGAFMAKVNSASDEELMVAERQLSRGREESLPFRLLFRLENSNQKPLSVVNQPTNDVTT